MGDPKTDAVRLRRISPFFNAARIKVPLMVLQGANDPRVLKVESDEIVEAARANGAPVEYVVFDDEGHGFRKKENQQHGYSGVLAFLDRHLKATGAPPEPPVAAAPPADAPADAPAAHAAPPAPGGQDAPATEAGPAASGR
jgi:dienelactone hydrolase